MCQPFYCLQYFRNAMYDRHEFRSVVFALALPAAHVAIAGPALSATTIHPHAISVFASIANAKRVSGFLYIF
jgi:hypothetical protein